MSTFLVQQKKNRNPINWIYVEITSASSVIANLVEGLKGDK